MIILATLTLTRRPRARFPLPRRSSWSAATTTPAESTSTALTSTTSTTSLLSTPEDDNPDWIAYFYTKSPLRNHKQINLIHLNRSHFLDSDAFRLNCKAQPVLPNSLDLTSLYLWYLRLSYSTSSQQLSLISKSRLKHPHFPINFLTDADISQWLSALIPEISISESESGLGRPIPSNSLPQLITKKMLQADGADKMSCHGQTKVVFLGNETIGRRVSKRRCFWKFLDASFWSSIHFLRMMFALFGFIKFSIVEPHKGRLNNS